jgi:hypothetical protein
METIHKINSGNAVIKIAMLKKEETTNK